MTPAQAQLISILVQISAFGLVMALWVAAIVLWAVRRGQKSRRISERLGVQRRPEHERTLKLWRDGHIVTTSVTDFGREGLAERLDKLRDEAGWSAPVSSVLLGLTGGLLFAGLIVWVFSASVLAVVAVMIVVLMLFWAVLQASISRQTAKSERQLLDALDLAARSLRAGHPLPSSFQIIAEEIPKPVGTTFAEICEKHGLGVALENALGDAAAESRSADMKIFAAAVVMQISSGGNLAEMMERVAGVIRERVRLKRKARILSAEAQLSKRVLIALPIGMFVLLNIINPEYMQTLYTTFAGTILLTASGVGLILGSIVMNKMATLRY